MKINKGDIILLCILFATLCFFAINEFNILAGLSQYDSSFTTWFGIIFGGELLTFAIYRIGMAKYESQQAVGLAKYDPLKNTNTIEQIKQDEWLKDVINATPEQIMNLKNKMISEIENQQA